MGWEGRVTVGGPGCQGEGGAEGQSCNNQTRGGGGLLVGDWEVGVKVEEWS